VAAVPQAEAPEAGPAETPRKAWSVVELRELVQWMRETWTEAFGEPLRPLALGVGKSIAAARPAGKSQRDIEAALRIYVNRDDYLEALAREGTPRVELDGSDAGPVEESHRAHALVKLEERMAIRRGDKRP
jgi:ProP effector